MLTLFSEKWLQDIFEEDGYYGDPASSLIAGDLLSTSVMKSKQAGIFCGEFIIRELCQFTHMQSWEIYKKDGDSLLPTDQIASVTGNTPDLLKLERVLLNLVAFASGIATKTKQFADIVEPYGVHILDTRKTLPGYRKLSKYAVRTGGGWNHRFSLSDLIMLKDNHIAILGGIKPALTRLMETNKQAYIRTEVEVANLKQALEALAFSPDIIMLDNFTPEQVQEAILFIRGKALIEVSGGITLQNVETYAKTKPDFISTGQITQHVQPIDIHMKLSC